jgi:hypothetical protein
LVVVEVVPS